jgi:DNA-binding XRE family transcriptional regulator
MQAQPDTQAAATTEPEDGRRRPRSTGERSPNSYPSRIRDDYERARFQALVGLAIRDARVAAGMTGRELAAAAGMTSHVLSNVERGHVPCSMWVASRIAEALDTTIDALAPVMITERNLDP